MLITQKVCLLTMSVVCLASLECSSKPASFAAYSKKTCPNNFSDSGPGLIATEDIQAGERVVNVSKREVLCDATGSRLVETTGGVASLDPRLRLALALLMEKIEPSERWSALVENLPDQIIRTLDVADADLKILDGTASARLVRATCLNHISRVQQLCNLARKVTSPDMQPMITSDTCRWAVSNAFSRSRTLRVNGQEQACLIPYLDVANHRYGDSILVEDADSVGLVATADVAQGEQFWTYHGDETLEMGFTLRGSATEDMASTMVSVALTEDIKQLAEYRDFGQTHAEIAALQVQLAQAKGCHKYIRAAGGGVEWKMLNNLLQCARLLEIDNHALPILFEIIKADEEVTPETNVTLLSWRNEVGALQRLESLFERHLDTLTRTDHVATALAADLGTPGAQFLLEYREAERQFLEDHMREIAHRLNNIPHDESWKHQTETVTGTPIDDL